MTERAWAGRALWIGIVALAVGAGGLWLATRPGPGGDAPQARSRIGEPAPLSPRAPGVAGWTLPIGRTVAISRDEVEGAPPGARLPVDLELRVVDGSSEPLRGRILSFDESREGRERPLRARVVGEEQMRARVELPADFLEPGLYLIELRTREVGTPLPLLRYRLEIR